MKAHLVSFIAQLTLVVCDISTAERYKPGWIWLLGDPVGNQQTVHAPVNKTRLRSQPLTSPGSRASVASWADIHGQVWMFGGLGFDDLPSDTAHLLGDLWRFDTSSLLWHQMQKTKIPKAKISNNQRFQPKPRRGASMCGVSKTLLILFGGIDSRNQALYDTWIFDVPKGLWLPLYIKNAHKKNKRLLPDARYNAATWCTKKHLIIFGGQKSSGKYLDDMWIFTFEDLKWQKENQHIQMDKLPSSLTEPFPRARSGSVTWVGNNDTLFMFGGTVEQVETEHSYLGDLWQFSFNEKLWKLVSDNRVGPSKRKHASGWVEANDDLILFGGFGQTNDSDPDYLNDLWKFDVIEHSWVKLTADATYSYPLDAAKYFVKNKVHEPLGRYQANAWQYKGISYLYSGFGRDYRKQLSYLDDMHCLITSPAAIEPELNLQVKDPSHKNKHLPAGRIFWICFSSFGGVVLVFGAVFFFKKMVDFPRHHPSRSYNVKYSPLDSDAVFDM